MTQTTPHWMGEGFPIYFDGSFSPTMHDAIAYITVSENYAKKVLFCNIASEVDFQMGHFKRLSNTLLNLEKSC